MQSFHTVIVGAGPGGLACARVLAEAGCDVLVLERNGVIGPKVCAGGITGAGIDLFSAGNFTEQSFCEQVVKTDWQQVRLSAAAPMICTVSRARLGEWLHGRAVAAGARVETAAHVSEIKERHVVTANGSYGFHQLVGADGSSSLVRAHLGLESTAVGIGMHYMVPGRFASMEWHMRSRLFANGYAWVFPHQQAASVGAYVRRGMMRPRQLLTNLKKWCGCQGIDIGRARLEAALINFDYRGWRFGNKWLVGDAAGLASGLTGEGIYPAIVSGETVARTILDEHHRPERLNRIIHKQQLHHRVLAWSSKGRPLARLIMEGLVLALRLGAIQYTALELTDH